jgi:tripartite-type tricarboxylate transporter receptor subunit TctC
VPGDELRRLTAHHFFEFSKESQPMKTRILFASAIALLASLVAPVQAQTFPSKVVKIVVTFAPGGAADILGRVLAESMAKGLGQPVIVENRPGGGAVIGYEYVARAPADGHTMLMVFPSFVINAAARAGVAYDPIRDFRAVGQAMYLPMAISVNPSLPIKSLAELIAYAKSKPGEISYGTPGAGSTHNVVGEMLRLATNINIVHVPYSGGGAQVLATAGGHIQMNISNVTEVAPLAKSGKVRAIVVTTPERAEALPDVPTFREAGYPELEATNWAGFMVPIGTPTAAVARLNAELVRALRSPEVQEKLRAQGMFVAPGTPEEFARLIQSESARYGKIVRDAGIKLE